MTIREYRKIAGLSQAEFAEKYGFNLRTLQDWEQGRHATPAYVIKILEDSLERSGDDRKVIPVTKSEIQECHELSKKVMSEISSIAAANSGKAENVWAIFMEILEHERNKK